MFKKIEKVVGVSFITASLILFLFIINKANLINVLFIEYIANFPTICLCIVLLFCGVFLIRGDK